MTKNRDLDTPFLTADCDHTPSIAVTEYGAILYWLCRCGQRCSVKEPEKKTKKTA